MRGGTSTGTNHESHPSDYIVSFETRHASKRFILRLTKLQTRREETD